VNADVVGLLVLDDGEVGVTLQLEPEDFFNLLGDILDAAFFDPVGDGNFSRARWR